MGVACQGGDGGWVGVACLVFGVGEYTICFYFVCMSTIFTSIRYQ